MLYAYLSSLSPGHIKKIDIDTNDHYLIPKIKLFRNVRNLEIRSHFGVHDILYMMEDMNDLEHLKLAAISCTYSNKDVYNKDVYNKDEIKVADIEGRLRLGSIKFIGYYFNHATVKILDVLNTLAPNLEILKFKSCYFAEKSINNLTMVLKKSMNLKELRIDQLECAKTATNFASALPFLTRLESLNISDMKFDCIESIGSKLHTLTKLKSLSITTISEFRSTLYLFMLPSLEVINLSYNRLSLIDVLLLIPLFQNMPNLCKLDLSCNCLTPSRYNNYCIEKSLFENFLVIHKENEGKICEKKGECKGSRNN